MVIAKDGDDNSNVSLMCCYRLPEKLHENKAIVPDSTERNDSWPATKFEVLSRNGTAFRHGRMVRVSNLMGARF